MSTLLKKLFRKTKFRSRSRSATKLSSSVPENCESDKPSNTQQRSVNRCQTVDTCQRFDRQTVINRQQSVSPRSSNRTSKYSLCKRVQHCAFINDDRLVCTSEQNSQCKICLKWFCKLHLQTHEHSPVRMKCKMTVHYQSPNDCSKVYNNAYSGIHDSVNVIDDTITNKVAECYPHTHQTVINRVTTELLGLVDYLDTFDKLKMADRRLDSRQQELNEIIRELKEYRNNSADIRQKLMKILEHEPDDSKQLRQLIENVENLKVKLYDYQQQLSMTAKEETVETNTRQKDSKTNTTAIVHVQKKEKNKMSTIDLVQRKPIQHFKCEKTVNGANLAATSYAVSGNRLSLMDHFILVEVNNGDSDRKLILFVLPAGPVYRIKWIHGPFKDICWSRTLNRFHILTLSFLYEYDPRIPNIIDHRQKIQCFKGEQFQSCTTTNQDDLFLVYSTKIERYSLKRPSYNLVKRWEEIQKDNFSYENVLKIRANDTCLALLIYVPEDETWRVDLFDYDLKRLYCGVNEIDRVLSRKENLSQIYLVSLDKNLQWIVVQFGQIYLFNEKGVLIEQVKSEGVQNMCIVGDCEQQYLVARQLEDIQLCQ